MLRSKFNSNTQGVDLGLKGLYRVYPQRIELLKRVKGKYLLFCFMCLHGLQLFFLLRANQQVYHYKTIYKREHQFHSNLMSFKSSSVREKWKMKYQLERNASKNYRQPVAGLVSMRVQTGLHGFDTSPHTILWLPAIGTWRYPIQAYKRLVAMSVLFPVCKAPGTHSSISEEFRQCTILRQMKWTLLCAESISA